MKVTVLARGFKRGQWEERKLSMARDTAMMHCPGCGAVNTLDDYSISDDGSVQPQFSCLNACGFTAELRLGGWRNR